MGSGKVPEQPEMMIQKEDQPRDGEAEFWGHHWHLPGPASLKPLSATGDNEYFVPVVVVVVVVQAN